MNCNSIEEEAAVFETMDTEESMRPIYEIIDFDIFAKYGAVCWPVIYTAEHQKSSLTQKISAKYEALFWPETMKEQ